MSICLLLLRWQSGVYMLQLFGAQSYEEKTD